MQTVQEQWLARMHWQVQEMAQVWGHQGEEGGRWGRVDGGVAWLQVRRNRKGGGGSEVGESEVARQRVGTHWTCC